ALTAGTHTITAVYSGSGSIPSSSDMLGVAIVIGTSTTLSASPNAVAVGQPVTFTATVTSSVGTPTGSVIFHDTIDNSILGMVPLTNGQATVTTSFPRADQYVIFAQYVPDVPFTQSGAQIPVWSGVPTSTALSSSLN